jgi:hypothetical protein
MEGEMETIEVLTRARALIERGHAKGAGRQMRDGVMCFCAVIAIEWAARGMGPDAADLGIETLRPFTAPYEDIVTWNDAPERTQADVLCAFDRAIAAEVARG